MDGVSGFFMTAPGWIWAPLIAYVTVSLTYGAYKLGALEVGIFSDEAALLVVAIYLAVGVFWPLALAWKAITRLKRQIS